jgi:hypothetical protein
MNYKSYLNKILSESKVLDLLKPMSPDEVPYNWTKNHDGSYDVTGNVNLRNQSLIKLPWKFNKVEGDFYCSFNKLTSLDGAPRTVEGGFSCHDNKLTSLDGAPQTVGGDFWCNNNKLTSLDGAPQTVGGHFYCSYNQLTSLDGAPRTVGRNFWCRNNKVKFSEDDVRKVCKVKGKIYT